jgi:hypothetical protein
MRTRDGAQAYRALSNLYLGEDVQQVLRTQAGLTLIHSKFDGKSKRYTLDKHINAYRQALIDLGPNDATSEQRKVELFMNSWQVPELMHLASGVHSNPQLRNSFDSTVVYLSGEMAALKTLNVYQRTTAAVKVKTDSDSEEQSGTDTYLEEEDSDPQAEEQSEEEDQEEDQVESDPEEPEQEEQEEAAARGKRSVQSTQTKSATGKRARRYTHSNVPQDQQEPDPSQQEPELGSVIRPQDFTLMLKGIEKQLKKIK